MPTRAQLKKAADLAIRAAQERARQAEAKAREQERQQRPGAEEKK